MEEMNFFGDELQFHSSIFEEPCRVISAGIVKSEYKKEKSGTDKIQDHLR